MDVTAALNKVVARLPRGGEARSGQMQMAQGFEEAIASKRHAIIQAGTGTGKTLAYLVPAVLSNQKVLVATATKGLQDQLAQKDLPFLAENLGYPFSFAVLKGRNNYICKQRLVELDTGQETLNLAGLGDRTPADEVSELVRWAETTTSGDRAELAFEPSAQAWAAVSVGPRECPGAAKCPSGQHCFTEAARAAAHEADVVVVNTHLLGIDIARDQTVLPEADVVVIDEAHQLEEIISATSSTEIVASRFWTLAQAAAAIIADVSIPQQLGSTASLLNERMMPLAGARLAEIDGDLREALIEARERTNSVLAAVRKVPTNVAGDVPARRERALVAATALLDDLDVALDLPPSQVAWVEGNDSFVSLLITPIDVTGILRQGLWRRDTVLLTSATIPTNFEISLGLGSESFDQLDVGSPFDYANQALLYCAVDMPDPRHENYQAALHKELEALMVAAGGRTLALFTSWRAMDDAAKHLGPRLPWKLYTQSDLPKTALVEAFSNDEESCLFATMGFWQGIDIPGPSLSLVTIDRLPFPRPDDPVLQARRERLGPKAFGLIDLPRAATLLAQGAGRLIRTSQDRGVVAVLDRRLATSRNYRWQLINALPPMSRTKDRGDVTAFLNQLRGR